MLMTGEIAPTVSGTSRKRGKKAPTFSSTDTTQFKRAIDMTDDELAAIAARAKLTVRTRSGS